MRMVTGSRSQISGLVLAGLLATCLIFVGGESKQAFANGGSWGCRGGSFGGCYGGCYGGGLFNGRRPVRNLLGRLGSAVSGGCYGCYGGSNGGCYGGSYGCNGTSYAYSSTGSAYGCWGASNQSYISQNYVGQSYSDQNYISNNCTNGCYSVNAGQPGGGTLYDSGYGGQRASGSVIDPVSPTPSSYYDGDKLPSSDAPTNQRVPTPGPDETDSTRVTAPESNATVLSLQVPVDAEVYINNKLTRTQGENRSYVSRNLKPNRDYHYQVKAVVQRDGKEVIRSQVVTIAAGSTQAVAMDFNSAQTTSLVLHVPENAKVKLCGNGTSATGSIRHFETSQLESGSTWKGYMIEVEVERNGQIVKRQKQLDMQAGEAYVFDFDFADSASEQVAAK